MNAGCPFKDHQSSFDSTSSVKFPYLYCGYYLPLCRYISHLAFYEFLQFEQEGRAASVCLLSYEARAILSALMVTPFPKVDKSRFCR